MVAQYNFLGCLFWNATTRRATPVGLACIRVCQGMVASSALGPAGVVCRVVDKALIRVGVHALGVVIDQKIAWCGVASKALGVCIIVWLSVGMFDTPGGPANACCMMQSKAARAGFE